MRKQQLIATRLATAAAIVGCLVLSLEAQQPPGPGGPGGPGGAGGGRGGGRGGAAAVDPNAPTPKLPSGKPDLSGSWQGGGTITGSGAPGVQVGDMFRRCTPFQNKNCMEWTNQSQDWVFMSTSRLGMNQPLYKPEYWDKVIEMDQWTNKYDPVMSCKPLGIPRQGPPRRIFHTENDITMIYGAGSDGAGGYAEFRMVPINNTLKHDPARANSYTFMGYTIGRWEGDTLVLDSIGFTDETWLARGGWIHSDQMRVIEKFTRTGNQMLYEVTVEDPVMFIKPWVMPPITMRNTGGNTIINERGACSETELEQVSSQERH
jgi:hypothetical protein